MIGLSWLGPLTGAKGRDAKPPTTPFELPSLLERSWPANQDGGDAR